MFDDVALVQRAVAYLTRGASVELTGARLSGRTHLLTRVRATMGELGFTVVNVNGTGGGLELEAIRLALPVQSRPMATSATDGGAYVDALIELLEEGPAIIAIDDLARLDAQSYAVLTAAQKSTLTAVVSTGSSIRSRRAVEPSIREFESPSFAISIPPMTREALHEIFQQRVDGSVAPTVSARIHTESAGVPGLAIAHLESAIAHGLIRQTSGVWVDGPEIWTPEMDNAYEALLLEHPRPVREALEILALTGAVSTDTAAALVDHTMLEQAEERGLVQVFWGEEEPLVSVSPPGLANHFRRRGLSSRRVRIVQDSAPLLAPASRGLANLEHHGTDSPADDQRILQHQTPVIARLFSDAYDVELTAAKRRWEADRSTPHASHYLWQLLSAPADPLEVDRVFDETPLDRSRDLGAELEVRYFKARWLLSQNATLPEALTSLELSPEHSLEFRSAAEVLMFSLRQEFVEIDPDFEITLSRYANHGPLAAVLAALTKATCLSLSGRGGEALDLLDSVPTPASAVTRVHLTMCRGLAMYATGRFAEAIEYVERESAPATGRLDRVSLTGLAYIRAASLLSLGRFAEAQESANLVLATSSYSTPLAFSPDRALLILVAFGAALTGREATAGSLIEQARHVGPRTLALPGSTSEWAAAGGLAAHGQRESAAAEFEAIRSELQQRNYALAAGVAKLAAVLVLPGAETSIEFRRRVESFGGDVYLLYLDARDAVARDQPRELLVIAADLHRAGATGQALRFHAHAARMFQARGDAENALHARTLAHGIAEAAGDSNLASKLQAAVGFTAREHEIARLIAAGRSNQQIAQDLFVSVRTVETHMRNIRRKTGANGRQEIATYARTPKDGA